MILIFFSLSWCCRCSWLLKASNKYLWSFQASLSFLNSVFSSQSPQLFSGSGSSCFDTLLGLSCGYSRVLVHFTTPGELVIVVRWGFQDSYLQKLLSRILGSGNIRNSSWGKNWNLSLIKSQWMKTHQWGNYEKIILYLSQISSDHRSWIYVRTLGWRTVKRE